MNKETATSLNRRLLSNVENNTTDSVETESRQAAEAFVCPDRHVRERSVLFYETPQPVAFAVKLPSREVTWRSMSLMCRCY